MGFEAFFYNHSTHDKENYSNYHDISLRLANLGALIIGIMFYSVDKVYDSSKVDVRSENMCAFNQSMADDLNLESIILPVGQGLSIGRVKG
ncbi:hypothetical protein [Metabacillus sp. KUDC1714]|uniref:hypothetical protein n=1 Tax=Metabacillus TaxID=2675233 RepID=UPI0037C9C78B